MLIFIYRFFTPDMMMRYHHGLGVGHYHVHQPTSSLHHGITSDPTTDEPGVSQENQSLNPEPEGSSCSNADALGDNLEYISDDPELCLEDCHLQDEGWQDTDSDGASKGGHSGSDFEDIEEEDYTGC